MMKRILILILAAVLCSVLVTGCGKSPEKPAEPTDPTPSADATDETDEPEEEETVEEVYDPMSGFVPVVRLAVCSDTHITDAKNERAVRLGKLFDTAYRYAQSHPTYNTVDAVLMAGDITNTGYDYEYEALKSVVDAPTRPETTLVTAMGNHEYFGGGQSVYLQYMSDTLDTHVVVNGFHIIGVSPRDGNDYPNDLIRWMKEELRAAAEDAPGMPIFVFQHHHIKDTVYVSRSWYTGDSAALRKLFKEFPQVIDFSGHSHGPINNPLSIWQEECTYLGTGTLNYFEMEVGMTGGTLPPGKENAAQYYIVEADAEGRVRILPYNILTDDFFKTPSNTDDPDKQLIYEIDSPADTSTFLYTPERKNEAAAPHFPEGSEITFDGLSGNSVSVTVPQALDDQCIYSYRLVAETEGQTKEVKYFSEYYFEPMPETVTCLVKGLYDGAAYTVKVYPVNAWGIVGEPLTATFETPAVEPLVYETNKTRYAGTFTDFESYTQLRRTTENGVFSGLGEGDYFLGEWNGPSSYSDTVLSLAEGKGYEGSTACAVTLKATSHSNRALYLYANPENGNPQEFEHTEYLRVWVDFTGIDFRKACFGVVTKYDELFTTDDIDGQSGLVFYCLAEGSDSWKKKTHGSDGCFGDAQNSSMKDFKGWLAFPTKDFAARDGSGDRYDGIAVKAIYMYFDYLSDSMLDKPFYLDEIAFVEDYKVFEENQP